jgi:hypothetical protein
MTNSHTAQAGEAGHQGSDRQAGKHVATSNKPNPGPSQAATASQTKERSNEAQVPPKQDISPDHLHPGPDRAESEKSLGALHHDQHEKQPNMYKEFRKL